MQLTTINGNVKNKSFPEIITDCIPPVPRLAASADCPFRPHLHRRNRGAHTVMIAKTIGTPYEGHNNFSEGKEDPVFKEQRRRHQAECLVLDKISRDCITTIHCNDDPETISIVKQIIDNSGLRINLKIIDRYQKSIKRE